MPRGLTGPFSVLGVVLAIAACSENVAPPTAPRTPRPLFSYSATGIALDQTDASLNENGQVLIKGFNPTNPHHGDAIVATFYWLGSTNIIDSVTDVITDATYTPVGNKYTLVEYVTTGGFSMATYVATNIQNFPDPNTGTGDVLAVEAHLSQSVTDGGVRLAAFAGVYDDFASALGQHKSASGSGTGVTVADAGAITVDSSAIAYAVTMGGLAGLSGPSGFTYLGPGSDSFFKEEVGFALQTSAATIDPNWSWFYGSQSTPWLAITLALRAAPPPTGNLTATTTTTGSDLDADGYSVAVDGGQGQPIAINGSVSFTGLAAGSHSIQLSGLAANCTASSANPQTVNVPSGGTATAAFTVTCAPITGNITVTTTSGGANIPASYGVGLDGGASQAIASNNGSVTYTTLAPGTHTVLLTVPSNCTVSGGATKTATVTAGQTTPVAFSVNCNAPPVVNAGPNESTLTGLLYSLNWSFTDANHNGPWTYKINWGDGKTTTGTVTSEGAFKTGHTYVVLLPQVFTVTVTVTDAAGGIGTSTKQVSVLLL